MAGGQAGGWQEPCSCWIKCEVPQAVLLLTQAPQTSKNPEAWRYLSTAIKWFYRG
jgi:hypothetical protein